MPPHKARLPSGLFYCPKLTKRMIEMSEEMKLVKPSVEYLDSYLGCLRRGVDPIRYRESETPLTN
jgi:hypothetical protein